MNRELCCFCGALIVYSKNREGAFRERWRDVENYSAACTGNTKDRIHRPVFTWGMWANLLNIEYNLR